MLSALTKQRVIPIFLIILIVFITWQTQTIDAVRSRIDKHRQGTAPVPVEPLGGEPVAPLIWSGATKFVPENTTQKITRPSYLEVDDSTTPYVKEKLAYVIWLSGAGVKGDDIDHDNYFIAVRILVWQLLHVKETKTKHDVVVMVPPTVSKVRCDRLTKDGAIVYPVEFLPGADAEWLKIEEHRWDEIFTKLRVLEMTQYNRILLLDGDSMVRAPLDPVFDDPHAKLLKTKDPKDVGYEAQPGEAPLPETYLLISGSEVWDSNHATPPTDESGLKKVGYFNAGFFMVAPSTAAFNYYKSFLGIPGRFDPKYQEQNLLNKAHEWKSPMPWREFKYIWNTRCPNEKDFEQGLVSMHEKWWDQPYIHDNQKVKDWLVARRWEMQGYYNAQDELAATSSTSAKSSKPSSKSS